jgi:predicted nucleic acid-binding protein
MAVFVLDASVALAWSFEDEATDWTDEFLERLRQGDRVIVPAHWAAEVANALLLGVRRKRIKPEQPQQLWEELGRSVRCMQTLQSPCLQGFTLSC